MHWIGTNLGLVDISRARTIEIDFDGSGDAPKEVVRCLAPPPNEKKYSQLVWHLVEPAFVPAVKEMLGRDAVAYLQAKGRARLERRSNPGALGAPVEQDSAQA